MRLLLVSMIFFVFLCSARLIRAAEPFDAAAAAKVVAPLVESETVAVVHLDFARISPDFVGELSQLGFEVGDERATIKAEAAQKLDAVLRAGGSDAYVVVSLGGESMYPRLFTALSTGPKTEEKSLLAALDIPANVVRRVGNLLVAQRLPSPQVPGELHPSERPELLQALAAIGDAPVQAVLMPPLSTRRVIEELIPQLPQQIGGGPSSVLTHGIVWAAAKVDLPSRLSFRLVIQSQDSQAAEALRAKWLEVLRLAGQTEEIRQSLPQLDKLTTPLTPKLEGDRLVLTLDEKDRGVQEVVNALNVVMEHGRNGARRAASMNNLKQLELAMHNYHDAHKHFPPPASHSPAGRPLLSWRVEMLPYLEQDDLYRQFHLDEPWDSANNKALIAKMPAEFRSPKSKAAKGRTNYVVPVGDGAIYASMKDAPSFKDIKDGLSHTIMIIEVDDAHAVIWTKPDDLPFDPEDPQKGIGRLFAEGLNAAMCDGSVHFFGHDDLDAKSLKALVTRAGGESLEGIDF